MLSVQRRCTRSILPRCAIALESPSCASRKKTDRNRGLLSPRLGCRTSDPRLWVNCCTRTRSTASRRCTATRASRDSTAACRPNSSQVSSSPSPGTPPFETDADFYFLAGCRARKGDQADGQRSRPRVRYRQGDRSHQTVVGVARRWSRRRLPSRTSLARRLSLDLAHYRFK